MIMRGGQRIGHVMEPSQGDQWLVKSCSDFEGPLYEGRRPLPGEFLRAPGPRAGFSCRGERGTCSFSGDPPFQLFELAILVELPVVPMTPFAARRLAHCSLCEEDDLIDADTDSKRYALNHSVHE